jgi:CDP-diglyceride synthetase
LTKQELSNWDAFLLLSIIFVIMGAIVMSNTGTYPIPNNITTPANITITPIPANQQIPQNDITYFIFGVLCYMYFMFGVLCYMVALIIMYCIHKKVDNERGKQNEDA